MLRIIPPNAKLTDSDTIKPENKNETVPPNTDGDGSSEEVGSTGGKFAPPLKLSEGVMYSITIEVLNDGQINIETAGGLNNKTMALLTDVFTIKEKHEVKPPTSQGDIDESGDFFSELEKV